MASVGTEARHDRANGLDIMPPREILCLLFTGQKEAVGAVDSALDAIAEAANLAASALRAGGRLIYAGAGSSGLIALSDSLELPGTFGIPKDRILMLMAGGLASLFNLCGAPEDDEALGSRDAAAITAEDCVICVSASGSTPYVLAVAQAARRCGARVMAIANNAEAALFSNADAAILLQTPPEIVAGSTRMGAATAQKIALNMLSTLAAVHLGHIHDDHMVGLQADNDKLRRRAARMVRDIAGVDDDDASRLLSEAAFSVKAAVLLAAGADGPEVARRLLKQSGDSLRRALEAVAAH